MYSLNFVVQQNLVKLFQDRIRSAEQCQLSQEMEAQQSALPQPSSVATRLRHFAIGLLVALMLLLAGGLWMTTSASDRDDLLMPSIGEEFGQNRVS